MLRERLALLGEGKVRSKREASAASTGFGQTRSSCDPREGLMPIRFQNELNGLGVGARWRAIITARIARQRAPARTIISLILSATWPEHCTAQVKGQSFGAAGLCGGSQALVPRTLSFRL